MTAEKPIDVRAEIRKAMKEIGVPVNGTTANIANAYDILEVVVASLASPLDAEWEALQAKANEMLDAVVSNEFRPFWEALVKAGRQSSEQPTVGALSPALAARADAYEQLRARELSFEEIQLIIGEASGWLS